MRGTRRIRRTLFAMAIAIAATIGVAPPALAQLLPPSIADQPAATLLVPYFEVDLANPAGQNTTFSVNNSSANAALAHVTVWSTMHVPVYSFNVYLTGFDVQTINVRSILNGVLPSTASAGEDPTDTISPDGPLSEDTTFPGCATYFPTGPVPQATIDHIKAALTGAPSPMNGQCAAIADGTQVARGYITVDTVSNCTLRLPNEPGYFVPGGTGDATNQNILWGDYVHTDHIGGRESGDGSPLVHIRANAADPETSTPGEYTFYGRLVGWSAADNREPLSTVFSARFGSGGAAFSQTTLTVWRDAKVNQSYFGCGSRPSWYPLTQREILVFDEQERPERALPPPFSPPPPNTAFVPFPAATQRVQVGSAALPTAFTVGWVYLNFQTIITGQPNPPENPQAAQAWVSVHFRGAGRYSAGWPAAMFDTAKRATTIVVAF